MTRPFFLRRTFLVDRNLQLSLVLTSSVYTLLILLLMAVGLFLPLALELDASTTRHGGIAATDSSTVMVYLHGHFWWVLAGCLVLSTLCSIRSSHRIAGPLVRFKRHLAQVGAGMLPPPLVIRRNDYLHAEVEVLNHAVALLAEQRATALDARRALLAALDRCGTSDARGAAQALAEARAIAAQPGEPWARSPEAQPPAPHGATAVGRLAPG